MVAGRADNHGLLLDGWRGVSVLTCLLQLVLGTSPLFAFISLAIFLLTPMVIRMNGGIASMGSLLFVASYSKLFFIAQWVKIFVGQPADSHLQAPVGTVFVLLMGVLVFMAAGMAVRVLFGRSSGLVSLPQDPRFLAGLAIVATLLTLFSIIARHLVGLNRAGAATYEEGQGFVLLLYMANLLPLAVAATTARRAVLSEGKSFIDPWVLATLLLTVLQGFWENVRLIMLGGGIAFIATYLSYGGKIRLRHMAPVLVTVVLMQAIIFPLIDLQRGIERGLGVMGFLQETFNIASDLLDPFGRTLREEQLNKVYYSWDTRLYYGAPLGFLDRFSPNPLDEVVAYVQDSGTFGGETFLAQLLYTIPNVILQPLGIERPPRGGEILEFTILHTVSNMNYGVFAETYAYFGGFLFIPINIAVLFLYLAGLRLLYGDGQNNYFMPFGFSILYFTYCNSDIADIGPQVTIQSVMNVLILVATIVAMGSRGRSRLRAEVRAEERP